MLERVPDVKATPKPERCVRPAPAADAGRPTVHRDGWQRVGARVPDHAGHAPRAPRAAATPASPGRLASTSPAGAWTPCAVSSEAVERS